MDLILSAILSSPLVGGSLSFGLAIGLLLILFSFWVYGGAYYTFPRLLLKWMSRRALRLQ